MRIRHLALLFALLWCRAAVAQPIYGHSQKEFYATAAERPAIDYQCWTDDPNPLQAGHVHFVGKPPSYMRVDNLTDTIDVPFTIRLHNETGVIGDVKGEHIRSIRWDATGSTDLPVMRGGGPNSLIDFSGVATVDHSLGDDGFLHIFAFPAHGWAEDRIIVYFQTENSRRIDTVAVWPVFSNVDPSAPIKPAAEQGNPGVHHRTSCTVWSQTGDVLETAGEVVMEISDYIPLAPIFAPWTTVFNGYNYTAPIGVNFPNQLMTIRKDADLHHGSLGTLLRTLEATPNMNKQFVGPLVVDPADYGTGDHKQMNVWTQGLTNGRSISAVVVFPLTVGTGIPAPTLCTDPLANNQGQPLPCTYPTTPLLCEDPTATNFHGPLPCVFPHTPVVTWVATPFFLEQQFVDGVAQNTFRFCLSDKCWSFPATPIP